MSDTNPTQPEQHPTNPETPDGFLPEVTHTRDAMSDRYYLDFIVRAIRMLGAFVDGEPLSVETIVAQLHLRGTGLITKTSTEPLGGAELRGQFVFDVTGAAEPITSDTRLYCEYTMEPHDRVPTIVVVAEYPRTMRLSLNEAVDLQTFPQWFGANKVAVQHVMAAVTQLATAEIIKHLGGTTI